MEEKGRPWLSKLGVATETTGVVSEWVDWETPRRWALFCGRKLFVRRWQAGALLMLALHPKVKLAYAIPRSRQDCLRKEATEDTQRHTHEHAG